MVLASCTRADDTVLDPLGGAGTVALVALQLGFKAITIDIFPDYTEEAKNRLANAPPWYDEPDESDATIRRSPLIDELSGDVRGIVARIMRIKSTQRGTGMRMCAVTPARRVQILTLRVPIRHSESCRVLRLFPAPAELFPIVRAGLVR